MSLFRIDNRKILPIMSTTFEATDMQERRDLQDMLRSQIDVIAPDVLIVAEEFGEWEDSRRRIDLLGLDKEANLVVFELKRTEDGGHMELQALRYAAMISTLTFSRLVAVFEDFLTRNGGKSDAEQELLTFLGWDDIDEDLFGNKVKIVLVAADFSKELCTSVMWLAEFGVDIRCVRIAPYRHAKDVLLDIQTVIPLPEVADYQVRIQEKKKAQEAQKSSKDYTKYDVTVAGETFENLNKRQTMFRTVKGAIDRGMSPAEIGEIIPIKKRILFRSFDGNLGSHQFIEKLTGIDVDESRYFTNDEQLFHDERKTYSLSNQWGGNKFYAALTSMEKMLADIGIEVRRSNKEN